MMKAYLSVTDLDAENVRFALGSDSKGKVSISLTYGPTLTDLAMVSPPAVTLWPRVTGDGNFGTMWGPSDITKAKFTLDVTDVPINDRPNDAFAAFKEKLDIIDDKLLEFIHQNQLKVIGRKNLAKEEVRMLQIRSVRPKYDKNTGNMTGHSLNLSTTK